MADLCQKRPGGVGCHPDRGSWRLVDPPSLEPSGFDNPRRQQHYCCKRQAMCSRTETISSPSCLLPVPALFVSGAIRMLLFLGDFLSVSKRPFSVASRDC